MIQFLLLAVPAFAGDSAAVLKGIDARAPRYGDMSRKIWEFAEVGYKEHKSAQLLKADLREAGFTIQDNVAGIPTAFTATWGSGKPVIAILGEYDALPGLSQQDTPAKAPRPGVTAGHGCGHNLLGAASALAAVSIKDWMAENKIKGTLRFYGAPAEEGGAGKVYMARAGAFADVDAVLAWHPGSENGASLKTSLANYSGKFRFYGKASHAAASPEKGRSALDGLILMSHAVDMLREHVPESTRMHYIFTNGGSAPNIVPDFAEGYYYARHPDMPTLDGIWARIGKAAEGAAIATETRAELQLISSVYNELPNDALAALFDKNLKAIGGLKYSPEEQSFAETLRKTYPTEGTLALGTEERILPPEEGIGSGSTDVSDVSWIAPTSEFRTATFVPGTPGIAGKPRPARGRASDARG